MFASQLGPLTVAWRCHNRRGSLFVDQAHPSPPRSALCYTSTLSKAPSARPCWWVLLRRQTNPPPSRTEQRQVREPHPCSMAMMPRLLLGLSWLVALNSALATEDLLSIDFFHDVDDTTISLGKEHACLIEAVEETDIGGEVICWGHNHHGQAEPPLVRAAWRGFTAASAAAVKRRGTDLLPRHALQDLFVQISAAATYTCGVTLEQHIICWGEVPHEKHLPGADFVQVTASVSHTCGLHQTGKTECWGACSLL